MSEAEDAEGGAHGRLDFISGTVFLVLSVIALVWAIPTFVETQPDTTQLSARFFPYLTAGVVAACSAALMVANRHQISIPTGGRGALILGEAFLWAGISVAVLAALGWIGFVPTGVALTLLATLAARHRGNWIVAGAIALILPVAVDQLVWHVFQIALP